MSELEVSKIYCRGIELGGDTVYPVYDRDNTPGWLITDYHMANICELLKALNKIGLSDCLDTGDWFQQLAWMTTEYDANVDAAEQARNIQSWIRSHIRLALPVIDDTDTDDPDPVI